jgi:hypothetical protein
MSDSVIVLVMAFLVGCIPLACCVLLQEYAYWDVNRKRKEDEEQ